VVQILVHVPAVGQEPIVRLRIVPWKITVAQTGHVRALIPAVVIRDGKEEAVTVLHILVMP